MSKELECKRCERYEQKRVSKRDDSDWLRHVVVIFIPAIQPSKSTSRVPRRRRQTERLLSTVAREIDVCYLLLTRVITVAHSFWPPVLLQYQNYTRKSGIALPKRSGYEEREERHEDVRF